MVVWIRLGLLVFWAAWMTVIWLTNACEVLKLADRLPDRWKFASRNYELIRKATAVYALPAWLNRFLSGGVIAW